MTTPKNTLKNWFKTSLKPSQEQFWAWLDSYRHNDDDIEMDAINGLSAALASKQDVGASEVIDVSGIDVYDPNKYDDYKANVNFVSYKNLSSTTISFRTASIYLCVDNATTGQSPETHPLKWEDQGETLAITASNTCNWVVGLWSHVLLITGQKEGDKVGCLQTNLVYNWNSTTSKWDPFCDLKVVITQLPGTSTTAVMSQKAVTDLAGLKVDKVAGKSLVLDTEIVRLAGINDHFRGTHLTLAALQVAIPVGTAGDEATVDAGVGSDPIKYIWDTSDNSWKQGGGGSVTVDQAINNGSINAVSGGAVYNAFKALKDGVVSAGDTLAKLYALILDLVLLKTKSIIFLSTSDYGVITCLHNFKVTAKTDVGGIAIIKTSADVVYILSDTVTAGDYLKVYGDTLNMRTFLTVEKV